MPTGKFGEIIGTTRTLEGLGEAANYQTKVVAPRNPKLVRGETEEFKMTPSQYMFQMSMDTNQKLSNTHTMNIPQKVELLDMSETTHQKYSTINIDEPMFQPYPSEVFFQNFEPFETYEVPLLLRNNDKVPRLVKVSQSNSPYFKIVSPHNVGHKVGPGLPTTFIIQFTPEDKKDYFHELICITEREKFVVPVRAIGSRAVLDFPDQVTFPESPVKYSSTKTLLVRNVGNREAKFDLKVEEPFTVTPSNGTIPVNDSQQIVVTFKPLIVGDHHGEMEITYDTGEHVYMALHGVAQDALVRLDKNSIRIENTYISMANQRTVTISNRSDVIAHFRWTQYATHEEENLQKLMFSENIDSEEVAERDSFLEECKSDPSLRDKLSILTRTFKNKKKLIEDDKMLFADEVIKIEPAQGEIWPNSSTEVQVIFRPEQAQTYTRTAFCDVTGRESRLPLRIRGDGIGPQVQFSFDTLDMGNIFINSTHIYEVVLANKGNIDAIFSLVPASSTFSSCFNFNPSEGIVMPDAHQAIQITFTSTILGDFRETFHFQIDGSPHKIGLTFEGSVVGPTFHFDVSELKFGTVSYGFVSALSCTLKNTALVPMTYTLRVPGDGQGESISSTSDYDSTLSDNQRSSVVPKEFEITPSGGTLGPCSDASIKVELCSNTVKKYDVGLVVDIQGVGEEVVTLPISAKCIVPKITVLTPILDYGRCFLRHPYEHHVKLQNDTDLPAKYELIPQQVDQFVPMIYTSPQPKGIIPPRSALDVPLVITPQGLEELETTASFIIFGNPELPLPVHLTCIGEGPVVHVMPLEMDWGTIPVLVDAPRTVRLSNESLIPAKFTAHMVRPNSAWRVEPQQAEIPPEQKMDLTVTACLNDCVGFRDRLQINFLDGPSRSIPLAAYGQGTTIMSDPPMTPTLNLGPNFSKDSCKRTFTLTNKGRRHQSLVWSTEGFHFVQKPVKRGNGLMPLNPKDMKVKDAPPLPDPERPIFTISPHRMELHPGESIDVVLEGSVDEPQVVKERLLCHAIIGRAGGKELIMRVNVNCEFISPLLEFSSDLVFFRVDKAPNDELQMQTKELELTNVSSLPLTALLALEYPFQLVKWDSPRDDDKEADESNVQLVTRDEIYMGIGESRTLQIQFDPAYKDDSHIRIVDQQLNISYQEHPHSDSVALRGEVYFPNLEFEKMEIDFGCILNDTEVTRYVNISNNSPMDVRYKWSFLVDNQPVAMFEKPPVESPLPVEDVETSGEESRPSSCVPSEPEEIEVVKVEIHEKEMPHEPEEMAPEDANKEIVVISTERPPSVNDNQAEEEKEEKLSRTGSQPLDPNIMEADAESVKKDEAEQPEAPEERPESIAESRSVSRLGGTPRGQPAVNQVLASLLMQDENQQAQLGVEEIFDILPLYGSLKPDDMEQITFTFYGHSHIMSKAKAICEVEGGPTYEITLKGQASLVKYKFDCLDIDYGKVMYDQVASAEIMLVNTGHVGLEFTGLGMDPGMASKPKPGVPVMIPHAGFIEPHSQQTFTVKFLPSVPERFHKSFQIQVAHFEPDTINVFGEGVFPRISLDLPRLNDADGKYESMLKEARERLTSETKKVKDRPLSGVSAHCTHSQDVPTDIQCHNAGPTELDLQMEVERLFVQEFAEEQHELTSRPDILEVNPPEGQPPASQESRKSRKKIKPKCKLPDYILDFGHVVLGTVRTHVVRATNTGWFATSFSVNKENLHHHGFNVELGRVKNLPGAPDHETIDFVVSFDPRGAQLGLGETQATVPINVISGPQICIVMKANVTMPDMQISTDVLDFQEVRCGECKVITVQLHNHKPVKCEWNSLPTESERRKADRHVPMHLRRKMRMEKAKPRTFEMMPPVGMLLPGQRQNVQVKFMPTEEKSYENRIAIRLAQSSQRIVLLCRGHGQEPNIEFDRHLIEFGPILPHGAGDEQEVIIRNPCSFPIEIYNLEFDRSYLEEEKILRLMKGYDEYNTILLPPRAPGDRLPQELLDYYDEQMRKLEEAERLRREAEEAAEAARREQEEREAAERDGGEGEGMEEHLTVDGGKTDRTDSSRDKPASSTQDTPKKAEISDAVEEIPEKSIKDGSSAVGDLEVTPVSAAIARHLGIDLTVEGKAARNRRGISIIIHGAPKSGKTSTAVALAKRYEAALLTVDGIVLEAISNGNTPAGLRARELCAEAAHSRAEELRALEGEEGTAAQAPTAKAPGGLSVEAVAAHTQGTVLTIGQIAAAHSVAHSLVSNRKTSTISDQKSKEKHHGAGVGGAKGTSSGEGTSQSEGPESLAKMRRSSMALASHNSRVQPSKGDASESSMESLVPLAPLPKALDSEEEDDLGQLHVRERRPPIKTSGRKSSVGGRSTSLTKRRSIMVQRNAKKKSSEEKVEDVPGSPQPLAAPIARRLSVSASIAGEEGLMSCVLPEELLIEILAERLLLNDCHRGVVIDGLETLFSQNYYTTLHALLKALNNRKFMYMVTLKQQYALLKEKEKKAKEEQARLDKLKEEEERIRLEEMSEDEYDALDEKQKAEVDRKRLEIKKARRKKEQAERTERERLEREAWEAEQKRLEEESSKGKKRRPDKDSKDGKKSQAAGKLDAKSNVSHPKSQEGKKGGHPAEEHGKSSALDRPESHATEKGERGDSSADDAKRKKEKSSKEGKRPISNEGEKEKKPKEKGKGGENEEGVVEEPQKETKSEADLLLIQRFRTFDHSYKDILELVDNWERSTGSIRPPTPSEGAAEQEEHNHPPSGRKTKKGADKHDKNKGDKDSDKKAEKQSKEAAKEAAQAPPPAEGEEGPAEACVPLTEEEKKEKRLEEGIGVPHLIMECQPNEDVVCFDRILDTGKLASVEEVLDGLGLGPHGPPIPPAATFSVVPYPVKRHAPPGSESGHYQFVATGPDDPNLSVPEEKPKEEEQEEDKSTIPDGRKDESHPTPQKGGKSSKAEKHQAQDAKKDKRQGRLSAKGSRTARRGSAQALSPPPGANTPQSETEGSLADTALQDPKTPKLQQFRWTIAADSEVVIRLRFRSEELGQYDQTLNFEIMGTRRRYQLYCRGICAFPTISREPRIVFPHRKKTKKQDEIVSKKYILTSETFEFGPLLVGKSRDKYKEGKYPENMEKLTILNTSPLEAEISFCFLKDSSGETYLLDPPSMTLKPGKQQELSVWAYPKNPGVYEDALVCCIKENPEPIIFKLLTYGVRPELELDKKVLHFDKVLLHRKDTKTLYLRNSTLLPVAWRLNGLENLGDDFSVSQESGIIEPCSEFALHSYFRAMKPVSTNRRAIRLEVSDVDNIMGLVQAENIQVHAEAYDVALDMSFPKGADGGIDFDTIRVMDEHKQTCSLKNKGKYDIGYQFSFEPSETTPQSVCDMFSVLPTKGTLSPVDRPAQVQVIFKSNREVHVKDQPILRCQVIEPNIGDEGETIASIPIKLSVRSVFSKYNIYPVSDINFGSMLVNSKKSRTFTIENKGDRFDFKYTISKKIHETSKSDDRKPRPPVKDIKSTKSRDGSSSGRSAIRPKRADSISDNDNGRAQTPTKSEEKTKRKRQEVGGGGGGGANQARLLLGMFSVFPAFGYILPGGHQIITVDCVAENPGRSIEEISIDITGRDPYDCPQGIPYKLLAEACIPSINTHDIGSIFEEHRICKNLTIWQQQNSTESGGVYGEEENKFVFNNVLVGNKAKARFKISNANKVPCDVVFAVKPTTTKATSRTQEVFEVEPARAQVGSHSHMYAVVSFTPTSMQSFNAIFEAAIDGVPPNQAKGRNLTFELAGDGNLPRISILKPSVRNKKGQPLLLFKKNLIGQTQGLPLVILNDGTLPSKVDIDLVDPDGVFQLVPSGNTRAVMAPVAEDENKRLPHAASVVVDVGESASFSVKFTPVNCHRSQAHLRMTVLNNQYEDSVVQMVGEGYEDEITLDNIHSVIQDVDPENEDGSMADDDVPAAKNNHIKFGDCFINEQRALSLSIMNHSKTDCFRFQWPDHPQLKFSPQVGHLHAGCKKDLNVTFQTDQPKSLEEHAVECKVTKITFEAPDNEVGDWDDRMKTVKWVDVSNQPPPPGNASDNGKPASPQPAPAPPTARLAKRKVIEVEPEPTFTEVPESARTIELLVSANSDFSKCKCKVESVHFRDTLMLQTRVYEFQMNNKGNVGLDYNWQVVMENFSSPSQPWSMAFAEIGSRPNTAGPIAVREKNIRPSSAASSAMSDSSYTPFSIEPESGRIPAGKKGSFKVKFSPLDVNEYDARLICSIPNLESGKRGPVIALKAKSLMPYCHFELEDSDYIRSARRNPELRGPGGAPPGTTLDPNTRVIELSNVGLGVRNVKKFDIYNPTNQDYNFKWINDDECNVKKESDFTCLVTEGVIRSGKKVEVGFEFVSSELDLVESFWRFVIPQQNIVIPFLLVGNTKDPAVSPDRSHLNFKSLLVGHQAVETIHIINSEDVPFSFSFVDCFTPGQSTSMTVEPSSGTVLPKSSFPVDICFTASASQEVNFNLVCNVRRKPTPLAINIKAEGHSMDALVFCEDSNGNRVELSSRAINKINFGEVEVNERAIRNIYVVNAGKFNFDYTWELQERSANGREPMVAMAPMMGGVAPGEREQCQLSFCPPKPISLRGCELVLKISNGPTYTMQVSGSGIMPGLHMSFISHDFGPCFIYRAGMPIHTQVLKLTNTDNHDIRYELISLLYKAAPFLEFANPSSVDCLYTPTQVLHHNFEAQVIAPRQSVEVTLSFYPRKAMKYHETIPFEVNGLSKQMVEIYGQGTEMKIEVADPRQKVVKFGALRVGNTVKKVIPIVNHSPASITFHLGMTPSNLALQDKSVLKLSPLTDITLPPKGGMAKVEVVFSPKSRIQQFTEEVLLECAGLFQPLFVITGSCQGVEVQIDTISIPFGAVVQKSSSTRKMIMSNTGDIGTSFKWNTKKFAPDFSISPAEGYISPGMEIPLEVTFHPKDISNDIRYDNLKCQIDLGKPLLLTLTGMCVAVPPTKEVVHFSTHVRHRDTKNVQVMNRTNQHWHLRPIIDGECWTGADTFDVEPQSTKPYELVYHPMTMTGEGKKHTGTVFFPLPDGTGLLYNVVGTSEPPRAISKITRDIPCKTSYTELLSVNNWLKKPQRFRIKTECVKPDKLDPGTAVKGLDYIDVPGNSKRDYKLSFYAHKEGQSLIKVIFLNEQTGEYQFYEMTFRAMRPGVISSIDLVTPVRQSVPHTLVLENPLSYPVTFAASCSVSEVLMPNQLSVPANSEGAFNFEYLPLRVGEVQGHLEFNCNDLGLYMYDLNLKATPSGPERALYFRTGLGSSQTQVAKFLNFAKQRTEYSCKVDCGDFHVDKTVAAAPGSSAGTEVAVEVMYEPSRIGESRGTLSVTSATGGDYTFPLFGSCHTPKPQGPFIIKAGSTTSITFRNVFPHTTAFVFQVDNPLFHVSKPGENVRSRKDHRVVVGFDGNDSGSKAAVMGKLTVSCAKSAGGATNAQWVFYLKGITPDR